MKNLNIEFRKNKKGITLVALVITIVVLLILAEVSLNLIWGNEGILRRSKEAAEKYGKQSENEQSDLDNIEYLVEEMEKPIKVVVNMKATANGTIDGKKPSTNNPIIPEGYTPINAGAAIWGDGTSSPNQSSVDNGLVIKDDNDNEWVWIPVELTTLNKMYVVSDNEIELSGNVGIGTKLYTNSITIGREGDQKIVSRSIPNTASFREPDLITDYDFKEEYYKTILEFNTPKAMAETFVKDYENMINSIKKYGGFYIGRYELSNEGVQKEKATLINKNWYELYKKCTTLNASDKVESRMIWGIQWDLACDFISKKGEQKSITNSNSWGNYRDSIAPANTGNYEKDANGNAVKKNTGSNEAWKANNIYDLAGNCWEWSQEVNGTDSYANRGGSFYINGIKFSASYQSDCGAIYNESDNRRYKTYFVNKIECISFLHILSDYLHIK